MDNIQTNISVVYTPAEDANRSHRFMDEGVSHSPISYNHGKATLKGGTKDHELATNVNMITIYSPSPIHIKVGDTTSPELKNMRMFVYDGDTTTIFVSNPGTDPVKMKTVTAKF